MAINFSGRVEVPRAVLVSEVDGSSIILNLQTASHVGLDEVGASIWSVVSRADSIEAAYAALQNEWTVDPARLRHDLISVLEQLVAAGLVHING